jgi:hypothetical protein
MGKINMQKVIVGGLIAGVVLNIVDTVLYGVILKDQMAAAMAAINKPPMSNAQIPWFVFLDFVFGVFLVWLYASMRPRFGAGPGTAIKAGVAAWFAAGLMVTLFMWPSEIPPHNIAIISTLVFLVSAPLATVIGAKFYTEEAGVGAGMGGGAGVRM